MNVQLNGRPNRIGSTPASPATTTDPANAAAAGANEVTSDQVMEWIERGEAVLIDVREPDEHARERIRGARLQPLQTFDPTQAVSLLRPGQRLVLHCRTGRRSADAARITAGVLGDRAEVFSLVGGLEAWKEQALPVEVDVRVSRISIMRQVQMIVGGGVLAGSALAWLVHPGFIAIPAFFGAGLLFAGVTGTCALATVLGFMPWNRLPEKASCAAGKCET